MSAVLRKRTSEGFLSDCSAQATKRRRTNAKPLKVLVGSLNPVKIKAAKTFFQARKIEAIVLPFNANPGINDWQSKHAIGQPFGVRQTGFGAIHRMQDCWKQITDYAIGFENGLVASNEIGEKGAHWFDICYTAVRNQTSVIVKRGSGVQTEFQPAPNAKPESFDQSVAEYHARIMPKIARKEDLYDAWTAKRPGGPKTRESFLSDSLADAMRELKQLEEAKKLIGLCVKGGMAASNGARYRYMLWTRDLAYMAPVYLEQGHEKDLWTALRQISALQSREKKLYNNGYEEFSPFGKVPIVCIAPENQLSFLALRLDDWCNQLGFPDPPVLQSMDDARKYYNHLLAFRKEKAPEKPGPSFALRHFMEGTLTDLTPGTRDSEIQFIRALFFLIDHQPQNKQEILKEFQEPLAHAMNYLLRHVLKNQLPAGADSRDIFADLLYDACTLTNAVFWYTVLQSLTKHAKDLESLKEILPMDQPLDKFFAEKLQQLKETIQRDLLFEKDQFKPRDFIPGERAVNGLDHPVHPTPIASLIKEDNPNFTKGRTPDPQGLAQAVLAGLIEPRNYNEVIRIFAEADSPIGISVFCPISGKTKAETDLLKAVKGEVVWPHVSWTVVRALIAMGTPEALNMAEEQRDKLMRFTGSGEWYAIDPKTKQPVQGGDPEQGWSASSMILALNAFYDYYKQPNERRLP